MRKTPELYTAIIKGIQSQGYRVECTTNKIIVFNPAQNGEMVFDGGIDAAQNWLLANDFNQAPIGQQPPTSLMQFEWQPFRRNSAICSMVCILIFLGAIWFDHNPGTLLLGLPGVLFFILAFFNAAKHFQWERKISEITR